MPSTAWTPRAVAAEALRLRRRLWRAVEAQHFASTLRLVQGAQEQVLLERILEDSKPALPQATQRLHDLPATPFRYPSPLESAPQTLFRAGIGARCADLIRVPFSADRALWTDPGDYAATQRFAGSVREAGLGASRYESVRATWHRDAETFEFSANDWLSG